MGFDEVIEFAKANVAAVAVAIGVALVLIAFAKNAIGRKIGLPLSSGSPSQDELRFRNVFGLMTDERREALITYYVEKYKCGRREAMRIAVDDRASDETRW
jgi:hypothetical protein